VSFLELLAGRFESCWGSIAGRLFTNVDVQVRRGMRLLAPVIEDRQRHIDEYGKEWEDKPVGYFSPLIKDLFSCIYPQNDLLFWLMDDASDIEKSVQNLTLRVLTLNFAALHTSSMVLISSYGRDHRNNEV